MTQRILIIDDSLPIRTQIKAVLGSSEISFLEAADGLGAFKTLVEERPDLVLCDLVMPDFDGMKFLAFKRTRTDLANIPVLMLTAESDVRRKVEILQKGAADYVTKPFHDEELRARVGIHLRSKALQDDLREANLRLESLAVTDPLSGLFNRRRLGEVLHAEISRSTRYRLPVTVVLIDIDHFKRVNDEHGHAMGDQVIRDMGQLLSSSVRTTDVAARYGGEEFAIVLTNTNLDGGVLLANRLRAKFAETAHELESKTITCTASFGAAFYAGGKVAWTVEQLLKEADDALYRAKKSGRNRVVASGEYPEQW